MVWNQQPITGLKADRSMRRWLSRSFGDRLIVVHYEPGEREKLRAKLIGALRRGPVVMWTPYAGVLDAQFARPWHHVSRLADGSDAVPFGPFTHSVTLFAMPHDDAKADAPVDQVLVTDCSVRTACSLRMPTRLSARRRP